MPPRPALRDGLLKVELEVLNLEAHAAFNEAILRFFDEVEGRGEALVA